MSLRKRIETPHDHWKRVYHKALGRVAEAGLDSESEAAQFAARFLAGYPNPGTLERYGIELRRFLRWCVQEGKDPFCIRVSDAKAFMASVACEGSTRGFRLGVLRAFYREAINDEVTKFSPFGHLRTRMSPKTPTPAFTIREIEDALAAVAATPRRGGWQNVMLRHRDYVVLYIGSRVGPRCREMCELKWSDVKVRGVTKLSIRGKGGVFADVVLPDDVVRVIDAWRTKLEDFLGRPVRPHEPIIPGTGPGACLLLEARAGKDLSPVFPTTLTGVIKRRLADAGLVGPRFAAHALRASAATIAYENGATLSEIQTMLRHKDVATTMMYLRRAGTTTPANTWLPNAPAAPDFDHPQTAAIACEGSDASSGPSERTKVPWGQSECAATLTPIPVATHCEGVEDAA